MQSEVEISGSPKKWKWNNNIIMCYLFSTSNKKAWDWYFILSHGFEIWQVARQQGCRATPVIFQSTCLVYFKIQPQSFESSRDLRDLKIRLLSYNLVNLGRVSMSHMWNGVSKKYFGNSSVAKRTTLPVTMDRLLHLWVAFGDHLWTALGLQHFANPIQWDTDSILNSKLIWIITKFHMSWQLCCQRMSNIFSGLIECY